MSDDRYTDTREVEKVDNREMVDSRERGEEARQANKHKGHYVGRAAESALAASGDVEYPA